MLRQSIALVCLVCVVSARGPQIKALWNMQGMAECFMHYNALLYNEYGCWCGMGGSGTPVDNIDACCMYHDHCYGAAVESGACSSSWEEYTTGYDWDCVDGGMIRCRPGQSKCQEALCKCDHEVTSCWAHSPKPVVKPSCPG